MTQQHTYETCPCEGCKIYRKENGIPEPVSACDAEVRRIAEVLEKAYWSYAKDVTVSIDPEGHFPELYAQARAMVAEMEKISYDAYYEGWNDANPCSDAETEYKKFSVERGLTSASENKKK